MVSDSEAVVESYFREAVSAAGGVEFKLRTPGKDGAPDRMAMFPNNRVFFVELKRPKGGRVRDLQQRWAEHVLQVGVNVEFLYTTGAVNSWVRRVMPERFR